MKHYFLIVISCLLFTGSAFAQTKVVSTYGRHEKPKDYVTITPGTISVGVGVFYNPALTAPVQSGISGKYFFNESWALRANLQFGRKYAKGIDPQYIVGDTPEQPGGESGISTLAEGDESIPDEEEVEIFQTKRESNFILNLGFEHRHKLSNRFFGYYGTDMAIGGSGKIQRTTENGKMIDETRTERACDLALLPFVGMEFFLGPKISLSSEFGYNILFKFYSKNKITNAEETIMEQPITKIASDIGFGNSIFAGLRLAYYF